MTEITAKSPYRFPNPKQQAIYEQLYRLIGPGPAANFRDAWRLLDTEPPYETATNIVAHLLRETESALRAIIPPPQPIDTQLIALLEKHNVPADGPLSADLQDYARKNLRTGAHQASIKAVLRFLAVPADDPLAVAWLETAESPYSLHRFAHRDNRNAPRPADNAFRTACERFQTIFENVLDRFEAQYLEVVATIDELRKKTSPSDADADLLVKILPNTHVAHEHLFTALNPAWLPLLHKKKFFTTPPPPIIDEEQGLISYSFWPEARYLAQIATDQSAQGLVAQILTEIPPTTNVRVHYDLCQAALALPPDLAAPWALQEAAWIEQQDFLPLGILALELAKLIVRLVEASRSAEARSLLRALVLPPPASQEGENEPTRRRPRTRIGEWEYQEILKTTVPALTQASPMDLVGLLVESLAGALGGGNAEQERREADLSYVWREAIDRDEDRGIDGSLQGLVTALRDTSSEAIAKDPSLPPAILQILDDRPGALYQRLALHLLRRIGPNDLPSVAQRLTSQRLLHDVGVRHEYSQLLHEKFPLLPPTDQQTIIDLIFAGPPLQHVRNRTNPRTGEPHTEEELARYTRAWTRDLLSFIRDALPEPTANQYTALVNELGEPESPEFPLHLRTFATFATDLSPLTDDEVREMPIHTLKEFLASWQPTGEFHAPSRDGIAAQLARLVATRPEPYAQLAPDFIGTHPTYVRGVINGFRQATDHGDNFDWERVLTLCQWAVEQRGSSGTEQHEEPGRNEWLWVRHAIDDLLSSRIKTTPGTLPFSLRRQIHVLLEILATDPNPEEEPSTVASQDRTHFDTAINSVRGKAIERTIDYAVWTKKHLARDGNEAVDIGAMPEVKKLLEDHLDPAIDPSLAVRSIYGAHLHRLFWVDREWTAGLVPRIFSDQSGEEALDREAWNTFLVYGYRGASPELFAALRPRYERAIRELAGAPDQPVSRYSPTAQLGHNLTNLYAVGLIGITGPFGQFFANAGDHLRAETIDAIGSSLQDTTESIEPAILQRFRELWESRVKTITDEKTTESATRELLAFASWFASGQWPEDWAADQLLRAYDLTGQAPASHWVLQRLPTTAATEPLRAIRILHAMSIHSTDTMEFLVYSSEVKQVVNTVLEQADAQAKRLAAETVSRLVAKGCRQFLELIPASRDLE